ncbi:DNA-processing protein DprA [Colwellia sp. UCD-KL20]|uniref:DNA-processing protein DprA n=1 Tax=Colwellia sp. UCD-KL20 TaxID=1917165 RepID=UPI000970EFDB|nr:DNA-processing protein DprA [Colwellia sp. UCD-KL20]
MATEVTSTTKKSNAHYWLALKFVPRLAIHKKLRLVQEIGLMKLFSSVTSISSLNLTEKQQSAITHPDWNKINKVITDSKLCGSDIVCFDDEEYPERLKQIYDPPLVLFTQGNKQLLLEPQIAIVGSRGATPFGRENAFVFAGDLVKKSIVITSGLALGIDAEAHKGALFNNGKTIAVVATGLDRVYPSRHKKLAHDIVNSNGLIVSEFVPGTVPKAGFFPKRNRIISGMSYGVLVVEATIKSGSLITARSAVEQNREVFAIPSSIKNPQGKGCHWLIKQGAKLVEECNDIIEDLNISLKTGLHLNLKCEQEALQSNLQEKKNHQEDLFNDSLLDSVGYEITPIDVVVSRSKLPIDVVLTQLTILELKGLVSAVPGGYLRT